jgi:ABC-type transport system involved in multi-copper enzyme maturation permease subunit
MVWISLGLLGLSLLIIGVNTQAGRWTMAGWTYPRGKGPTQENHLYHVGSLEMLPWQPPASSVEEMALMAYHVTLYEGTGFFVFSDSVVFALFTTFLLPMWSVAFATEGLGREREAQNLLWVLTRPISRPAIFLAKYVALLPWCLLLNFGGFTLLCLAGGQPGRLALQTYWPAVIWGTLAFSALFHLMAACLRRAAVVALLYAFFLETIMGNMPGHFKRLSISFYTRCLMFDRAHEIGVYPERPLWYLPVDGTTAWLFLAGITVASLIAGAIVFTWNEYLDVS